MAGVAAAWRASESGADVVLVERCEVLGGKLRTHEVDGLTLEAGAESLLTRRPEALVAVEAAGLSDRLVSPSTSGAGVWTDTLHPLPKEQLLGIPCDVSDPDLPGLLGDAAVDRLAREPQLGDLPADTTVGGLVTQQLGRDVVDLLVEPLLGGVYAGRADDISLDAALPGLLDRVRGSGSLVRAARDMRAASASEGPAFASLVGGLGALPETLLRGTPVQVRRGASAVALTPSGDGWRVTTEDGVVLDADAVVLALPGYAVATLLAGHAPDAATVAAHLEYASVALVTTVFDGTAVQGDLPGTGFLVPPVTGRLTKAATFVSRKWQWVRDAAPDREVLRFSVGSCGGRTRSRPPDDDLVDAVLAEVRDRCSLSRAPPRATTVTRWERSLPQYRVGHRAAVAPGAGLPARPASPCAAPPGTASASPPASRRGGRRPTTWCSPRAAGGQWPVRHGERHADPDPSSSAPGPAGRTITGKQARDLNDVIRYTAWSVFRATEPQVADRSATSRPRWTPCSSSSRARTSSCAASTTCRGCARTPTSWSGGTPRAATTCRTPTRPSGRPRSARRCEPVWSQMALHRPAEFNKSHIPAFLADEEPRRYVCVYPFVRSYEWYLLPDEERRAMLVEHGQMGRDYADVRANTVAVVRPGRLRVAAGVRGRRALPHRRPHATPAGSTARRHVREEIPFYTGRRRPVQEIVASLP